MEDPDETTGPVPLAVDLDGTLCRTDTLLEALLALVREEPSTLLCLPGWLQGGRAAFKARVAERKVLSAGELPLNEDVLELVRTARAEGRKTLLVSAADERQAKAIAADTGLFDEAIGSTAERNLKGGAKADYLSERFGEKGFDYVGDGAPDLDVWRRARSVITVNAGTGLRRSAQSLDAGAQHIGAPRILPAVWRAIRPHQWLKNLLVFMPVLAAHDLSGLLPGFLAFVAFSLAASSAYLINDLLDLAADRDHPRKRSRPFANGDLSLAPGAGLAAGLFFAALALPLLFGLPALLAVVAGYFGITLLYSIWLKRKLVVDILVLAGLYTLRIIGGGVAAAIVVSPWMLGFSVFLFLCLAAIKRQAELMDAEIPPEKVAGRAYARSDLPIIQGVAISAAHAAVLIFALYISSDDVRALYPSPEFLWFVCPVLLYWTLRMIMKTHRGEMTDDPIVFAISDRNGLLLVGVSVLLIALGAA